MNGKPVLLRIGVVPATAAMLVLLRPDPGALLAHLSTPRAWIARAGADAVAIELAGAALWVVAAWVAVGVGAAVIGQLPGAAGRLAHRIARRMLPAAVMRVLVGASAVSVALAPAAAGAQAPPPHPVAAGVAAVAVGAGVTPAARYAVGWPTDPVSITDAPRWPLTPTPGRSAAPAPAGPLDQPGPAPTETPPVAGQARHASAQNVTVQAGNSLWQIAARRLGPHPSDAQIAAAWPSWYAANRDVIGPDPDLIYPGQVLRPPGAVAHPSRAESDRP